jgi:hypothetical protein
MGILVSLFAALGKSRVAERIILCRPRRRVAATESSRSMAIAARRSLFVWAQHVVPSSFVLAHVASLRSPHNLARLQGRASFQLAT